MNQSVQKLRTCSVLMILFCWIVFTGCPSDENKNPDGGPTDGGPGVSAKCEKGSLCIDVSDKSVRSCELLFSHTKPLASAGVGFHESVIGRSKYRGSKLAVAFILQKDAEPTTDSSAVIRMNEGVAELKLEKADCYDRKGAKLSGEAVKTRKP